MAHSRSARKRVRTAARRTEINRARRSRVRTFIKKVEAVTDESPPVETSPKGMRAEG